VATPTIEGGSLKNLLKPLLMTAVLLSGLQTLAQNKETPPMEPPYTDANEFDPVLSEDPSASNQPIPVTPGIQAQPTPAPSRKQQSQRYTPAYAVPTYKKGQPLEKGVKLIQHPDSKKGLLRIEADGSYIYKVKTTPKDQSGIIRFGMMDPPNILSADGNADFKTMYSSSPIFTLMFDYEWQPFSKYGKLGLQAGGGFSTTSGSGRFLTPDLNGSTEAQEKYNFIILPMNLGVIYRLEYFARQWVAPYISGGGSYIAVAEIRDDGKNNFTGTPAAYGAGGLMFNITALDKAMAYNLDAEYGVGNLWLVGEYRYQKAFSQDLDFTGGILSLGISADF
jgi:hypothetical protein